MHRVSSGIALFVAAVAAMAPSTAAQCVTGGAGGLFPASGAVTGTWDSALPTGPLVTTLAVTVPSGATVLNAVKLMGLSHTFGGDAHVVLTEPGGLMFNVIVMADATSSGGGGCGTSFGGDYTIVDPVGSGVCTPVPTLACAGAAFAPGTYQQFFSTWTSGSAGVSNTPLEQIPISSGIWTLSLYDWYPPADDGSLVSWELCFGAPTPPPPPPAALANCVGTGPGGTYPAAGAVAGVWPTTLPTGELASPLAVTVPAGATKILAVKLNGLAHTWYDDTQIVLEDPMGVRHNVVQANDGAPFGTCGDTFTGDFVFVDAVNGQSPCGGPAGPVPACGVSGVIPPGTYLQTFGLWPTGSAGVANTPLESIPISSGTWTLYFYDWYIGADDGTLVGWELCFDAGGGPVSYCTAGTTTNGCLASMSATANPSLTQAAPCVVNVSGVEGQKTGIVFYGLTSNIVPWAAGSNSFLCVKAPTQRTGVQGSNGTLNGCDGAFTLDWDLYQANNPTASGNPWSVGAKAYVQSWFRDPPAVKTTNLSDALELTYVP